jgi:hypothetical protein
MVLATRLLLVIAAPIVGFVVVAYFVGWGSERPPRAAHVDAHRAPTFMFAKVQDSTFRFGTCAEARLTPAAQLRRLDRSDLVGTRWIHTQRGQCAVDEPGRYYLTFLDRSVDNKVDCNSESGTWTLHRGAFRAPMLMRTSMGCLRGDEASASLADVKTIAKAPDGQLYLLDRHGFVVIGARATTPPPTEATGPIAPSPTSLPRPHPVLLGQAS